MCHLCRHDDADDRDLLLRPSRSEAEELARDAQRAWDRLSPEERDRRSTLLSSDPWIVPTP